MNRKVTWKERLHSGFTLLEIMIVLAIVAILTTVLLPTVNNYLTRSRLNTANSNAKVIFNSLQTIMQEYEFSDRSAPTSDLYGTPTPGAAKSLFLYGNNGALSVTYNGTSLDPSVVGPVSSTAPPSSIGSKLFRLYSDYDNVCWKAYVKDYTVQGVVCATTATTDYIGGYPIKATERGRCGSLSTNVGSVTEGELQTYSASAWTVTPPAPLTTT